MAPTEVTIGQFYKPQYKQRLFHASTAKYPLMEGGRGGGKSLALLWEAIRLCIDVPGCNCLLLRRTLTATEKGGIEDYFTKKVPLKDLGIAWNGQKHRGTFSNKSQLFFGYIQGDGDLGQYMSAEFLFIGWDELTQFTYSQWDYMKGSNRCPVKFDRHGRPTRARMGGATNPNGIGSGWVKALWITKKPPAGEMVIGYDPKDYEAIHSTFEHNEVYRNDAEYITSLTSISDPVLRAAWVPGDWNILAGQYFQNWEGLKENQRTNRHIKLLDDVEFEDWQERWIGIDWGFAHACVVLWFTRAKVKDEFGRVKDRIVQYREMVVHKMNETAVAEKIGKMTGEEKITRVFLSPDRFNRTNEEHTIADSMGDALVQFGIPRPERANNDRVGGWQLLTDLFELDNYAVLASCTDTIDCIPKLQRDPKNLEDAIKEGNELHLDVCEALRYGCMSYATSREVPREIAEDRYIKSLPSYQNKYLEHLRLTARKPIADIALNVPMAPGMGRRH